MMRTKKKREKGEDTRWLPAKCTRFTIKKMYHSLDFHLKDKCFLGNANIGEHSAVARQFETPRCHIDSMCASRARYK